MQSPQSESTTRSLTLLCTQINDYIVMVDAQPLVHTYLDTHSRTYERSDIQPTIKVIAIEKLWL